MYHRSRHSLYHRASKLLVLLEICSYYFVFLNKFYHKGFKLKCFKTVIFVDL
jgi:hypothetical protein